MVAPGAVLVLDEDPNLLASIAQILKQAGYIVSTACSACEARTQLASHPFGLMFLDIGLMAGVEMDLVTELVRTYPCMPLVILSPYLNSGDILKDCTGSKIHFLVKPVDPATFLDVIRSVIYGENRPS